MAARLTLLPPMQRTQQISLIDFGACREFDAPFASDYMELVRACAEIATRSQ